ncbi:MAG: (Fe-S)-binding protein [Methanomassiliicoccaceae archaeon]|nr:(Fe-S)-binding protein [Methanomassiliicoccaceae archaeon]
MFRTAGEIVSLFSPDKCTQCGICSDVCPSGRNGGIIPDIFIDSVLNASPSAELSDLDQDVWRCLMCHRCSYSCPEGIDVAGIIREMRYNSAISGNAPKRFIRTAGLLAAAGRAFPVNEIVNRRREELGLNPIATDADAMDELRIIMKRTGFCDE